LIFVKRELVTMPRVLMEEVESVSSIKNLFQHIPGVSAKFVAFITELGDGHGKKIICIPS